MGHPSIHSQPPLLDIHSRSKPLGGDIEILVGRERRQGRLRAELMKVGDGEATRSPQRVHVPADDDVLNQRDAPGYASDDECSTLHTESIPGFRATPGRDA